MELRQLEYFVAVAEEANFTRAADRVNISQSGISAQLRQLERDLGAALIDRSGRTATLTAAGAAALEHARVTLASANAVRQAVDDVIGLIRGRLVVGMVSGCTITPLFDALSAFHRAHPGVEVTLVEGESDQLTARVRTGAADLALIGTPDMPLPGLNALTILSERVIAAVSLGHPLAGRSRVTLADISAYPIISLPTGTGIRTVFDRACAAAGVQPDIALQASAPAAVADLAGRDLGIAILSESMTTGRNGQLKALSIDGLDAPAALALIWATKESPALRSLLEHSREAFNLPSDIDGRAVG